MILKEKAPRFFALLNEAYRADAQEKLQLINIAASPYMDKKDLKDLRSGYQKVGRDIIEMIKPNNDYSRKEDLKKVLS